MRRAAEPSGPRIPSDLGQKDSLQQKCVEAAAGEQQDGPETGLPALSDPLGRCGDEAEVERREEEKGGDAAG